MKKIAGFLMCVPLIFSVVHAGEADYVDQTFARLNYITGDTYVQRATDLGYESGIVNMPIAQGDRVGTTDGRAEIYLGIGTYLRLDRRTKLDILDLPHRSSGSTRLRLWDGNSYFSVRKLDEHKPIEIHTSDVSLYILDRGLYRIDVRENRETEIYVFSGMLEAAGNGRSSLIKSGQRLKAVQGQFTSNPAPFILAAIDSFDLWSENREDLLGRRLANYYLPDELGDFEYELASYGRWDTVSPYGHVWIPGDLSVGWRPFHHGRWVWYPVSGWTWVPYEPWGWVTCHYGRWHWRLDLGWYWIPTTRWGPGWVSWYVGVDYCGWAPLTYYGRPAVIINNHFYARYSEPYSPATSAAMTMVAKNQLSSRDIARVSISKESLSAKTTRVRMSSSPPRPEPSAQRMTVQKLEKDKVTLRVPDGPSASRSGSRIKSGASDANGSRNSETNETMKATPRRIETSKSQSAPVRTTERSAPAEKNPPERSSSSSVSTSSKSRSSSQKSASSSSVSSASKSSSSSANKGSSASKSSSSKSTSSKKKKKK
ncbi:MAG: FecR family protein [Candidatus Aminicenantaceae bacterium]